MTLSPAQRDMLETLAGCANQRVADVSMMVTFGPQWRRSALKLERLGLIEANRNGWRVTTEGKRAL